jgi:tRNA threonylcarbamoyladenosine biosynthesis protein TsaB
MVAKSLMSEPRLLLLETSGRAGWAALAEGPHLREVHRLDEARRHARDLAPAVASLLAGCHWRARDLDAVVVGRGPGSYTGLRVGIMSAKAFAYATGCALLGLDTFATIAARAPAEISRLAVLADAQQDKVYAQEFTRDGATCRATSTLAIVRFEDWLAGHDPGSWVTGPGLARWEAHLPASLARAETALRDPTPQVVLRLGLSRFLTGERDDVFALEPLYLRPSSAEEQWQARQERENRKA